MTKIPAAGRRARALALAAIFVAAARVSAADAPPSFEITASTRSAEAPRPPAAPEAGPDRAGIDIDALEKYDDAVKFEQGDEDPSDKAATWRNLGGDVPALADVAERRAQAWDAYAVSAAAAAEAARARAAARDADWTKLAPLLSGPAASKADKRAWAALFVKAYLDAPGVEPAAAKILLPFFAPGAPKEALKKLAQKAPREAKASGPSADGGGPSR